jgi:hypothetical protein
MECAGRRDSSDPVHRDVHEDEIGMQRPSERDRLLTRGGLADEPEPGGGREERASRTTERRMIVGDDDTQRHGSTGISPVTRPPAAAKAPPSELTRSTMVVVGCPSLVASKCSAPSSLQMRIVAPGCRSSRQRK